MNPTVYLASRNSLLSQFIVLALHRGHVSGRMSDGWGQLQGAERSWWEPLSPGSQQQLWREQLGQSSIGLEFASSRPLSKGPGFFPDGPGACGGFRCSSKVLEDLRAGGFVAGGDVLRHESFEFHLRVSGGLGGQQSAVGLGQPLRGSEAP